MAKIARDDDHLKFPSGNTALFLKKQARFLVKKEGLTHAEALDRLARENGVDLPWGRAIRKLKNEQFSTPTTAMDVSRIDTGDLVTRPGIVAQVEQLFRVAMKQGAHTIIVRTDGQQGEVLLKTISGSTANVAIDVRDQRTMSHATIWMLARVLFDGMAKHDAKFFPELDAHVELNVDALLPQGCRATLRTYPLGDGFEMMVRFHFPVETTTEEERRMIALGSGDETREGESRP